MQKKLYASVAFAALMIPGAAYAQSTGSIEFEKGDIVVTGARNTNVAGTKKSNSIDVTPAQAAQKMVMMMTALRKHVEENCDYVGDKFAEVARRIHYEEEPHREIYGEATPEEARELIEEGVDVAPLPVLTPRQAN